MGSPANITNRSKVAGLGEQPSITDRDPGDESGLIREATERYADFAPILYGNAAQAIADDVLTRSRGAMPEHRIEELLALNVRLVNENAHLRAEVAALHEAENARLRMAAAAPVTATTPPPHNPIANALTHGWATTRYSTERN